MRNATEKTWKWALLGTFAALVAFVMLFTFIRSASQKNVLDNKFEEAVHELGMLAAAVNADPDRPWYSHNLNLLKSIEYLDELPFTFAALYMPYNTRLHLASKRDNATNFDPREFEAFNEAVREQVSGELIIGFTPIGMKYRDMHLYFRWMPEYSKPSERYLLVVAVSEYSITIKLSVWISYALQSISIPLALFFGWVLYLKLELGAIIAMRKGDTLKDKHRCAQPAPDEPNQPSGSDKGERGD